MKLTQEHLIEQRNQFNNAASSITNPNKVQEMQAPLDELALFFDEFAKRGKFERPDDERKVMLYRSGLAKEERAEADAAEVEHAKLVLARAGLRLLQVAIPNIQKIAEQCLEVAGKDAVRVACAPTQREGTDWQGKPYSPTPSEFALPPGYEPKAGSVFSKVKAAIGR